MNVRELLKRALMIDAQEVRLIPGRRIVVVVPQGESEVRGEPQSPEKIHALLEQVIVPDARRALTAGFAEWEFQLDDKGPVRAEAELKVGLVHATFYLEGCGEPVPEIDDSEVDIPSHVSPRTAHASSAALRGQLAQRDVRPLKTVPPAAQAAHHAGIGSGSTEEIDQLLGSLLELGGSDLHLVTGAPPMVRRDGEVMVVPGWQPTTPELVQRMLWPIVPPRNRKEFDELHDADFAYELAGRARFRVNIFVDHKGMGSAFRVIPSQVLTVEQLNLPRELLSLCRLPKGLVLVTGPTGSGKSTTLAALVDYCNKTRNDHIITIEDPIEFVHQNQKCLINQRQVGEHTKSFKAALRAALREDPDIVLLGEMRDLETIAIALETAETGHLVFGTLHTSSAPATVDRIIDQFPANQQNQVRVMLANSLKGVISQMLCRRIGGGRVAALEVLFGVPAVANLIREAKVFQIPSIMQTGRKLGMCLMNDSLIRLVKEGQIAPDEALNKSNDKATLLALFQQHQIQVPAATL